MKAVVLENVTKAKDIEIKEIDIPKVKSGWVLVKVKSFGLNHSEKILMNFEIERDYIQKPIVPGIECAGIIADKSDSEFENGDKVIALMGGMGRSFNGSYSEYCLVPSKNVFKIGFDYSFDKLAAIGETYFTAYASLFESLKLKKEDTLLIRGATCSLGYAAIELAKAIECKIIATTHKKENFIYLEKLGIKNIILDDGKISDKLKEFRINKILELVGAATIKDSLKSLREESILCHTGILGNVFSLNNFDPIKDIPNNVYLTGFYSNFPNKILIYGMFKYIDKNNVNILYGKKYKFSQISKALIDFDEHKSKGKIIVVMD